MMAQLYFNYGAMSSSKSASLLMVAHNYETQGKKVLLFTPAIDDRDGVGIISSRTGMKENAIPITAGDNIEHKVLEELSNKRTENIHCVLVDESQFLTREHVEELSRVVDNHDIPVMCYGLKNDFQNKLFEGTEALIIFADKIQEIKTICNKEHCGKKAIMNLRLHEGKPVYQGEQIEVGGDERYIHVCRKHYYNFL